jgi:hypothetical protein
MNRADLSRCGGHAPSFKDLTLTAAHLHLPAEHSFETANRNRNKGPSLETIIVFKTSNSLCRTATTAHLRVRFGYAVTLQLPLYACICAQADNEIDFNLQRSSMQGQWN